MILKLVRVIKENPDRSLVQLSLLSNLILILVVMTFFQWKTHFLKKTPYTSSSPVKSSVCHIVMDSILKKNIHPYMTTKEVKLALRDSEYKALKLNFNERLLHVFETLAGCKVVLKDEIGLRAFDFTLDGSGLNPFYYQVSQITEKDIQGEE